MSRRTKLLGLVLYLFSLLLGLSLKVREINVESGMSMKGICTGKVCPGGVLKSTLDSYNLVTHALTFQERKSISLGPDLISPFSASSFFTL
uniref:Uncharacterized protein n=1 Tax=Picea sitchensis TaxID=3332 RepID=A0A6B9XY80_PICSI|nr:hypothetical protein Q903MT_gene5602 [Picea sitchensis]